jgi:CRP/FNR family transcriptional regulator
LEVASLGPGSCFGEMAIFDGAPRSATARVARQAELLTLSGAALARAGRAHPALYETLLRVLSRRLREATDRLR